MASWKKIITSGSNAELNNVTASELRVKNIVVTGSGTITADNFEIGDNGNAIAVSSGGTGQTTLAVGQILIGNAQNGITSIASSSLKFEHLSGVSGYGSGLASASNASLAKTHLGLGSMGNQNAETVSITGGSLNGAINISSSAVVSMSNASNVFSGSFSGDGSNLTGVSTVTELSELTDIGNSDKVEGNILVVDAAQDSFDSVALSGDATLAGDGALTIGNDKINAAKLGVTAGAVTASKAVVVDTNKDVTALRNVTATGLITSNDLLTSAGARINGQKETYTDSQGNTRKLGLLVENDISASGFVGEFFEISSSIVFDSSSTEFGDADGDTHTFHGDLIVGTGSTSVGPGATGYPSYASGADSTFGTLGMHDMSGSFGQFVDFRSALGGVSGSFVGRFRGDGSGLTGLGTQVFSTIAIAGQTNVTADNNADTLTIASSSDGLKITTSDNTITFDLDAVPDTSLDTIKTANAVSASAIDIDGASDIGAALVDDDLLLVDQLGGGANRKTAISRIPTYLNNHTSLTSLTSLTSVGQLGELGVTGNTSITGSVFVSSSAGSSLDLVNHDGSANGLKLAGTLVTSTATELNQLDGVSAGTVTANKAVVAGANGDTDFSSDATIKAGTISGSLSQANQSNITTVGTLDGGSITSGFGSIDVGDSTITTTGAGSFGSVTTSGNLTVNGDLSVLGNSTEIKVDRLAIEDNIIVIGSGSNSISENIDTGIAFERGNQTDQHKYAAFFFDETANRFAMGLLDSDVDIDSNPAVNDNPSLVDNPAYVMTVVHSDTDPTTVNNSVVSASNQSNVDFGTGGNDSVGQVRIVNGEIFIYTD